MRQGTSRITVAPEVRRYEVAPKHNPTKPVVSRQANGTGSRFSGENDGIIGIMPAMFPRNSRPKQPRRCRSPVIALIQRERAARTVRAPASIASTPATMTRKAANTNHGAL